MFQSLKAMAGASAVTVQGVNDYTASIPGYIAGGDAKGSAEM
jgi:cutinase